MSAKKSKTALVLASGGVAGAVYEIGALRAMNDLLVDRTVNDFDVYVGTSAGAIVASCLASGISPGDLLQTFSGDHPEIRPIKRKHIFSFNNRKLLRRSLTMPRAALSAWLHYMQHPSDATLYDLFWSAAGLMPAGMYDIEALERYFRDVLERPGVGNRFQDLERELYLIATDLNTGERLVLGSGDYQDVPISRAVAASSAMPLVYQPVRVGDTECIDGGIRGTASLDVAIDHGANLIVCVNPLVPYDNRALDPVDCLDGKGGQLSEQGAQHVTNQVTRIFVHAGLHYHIKQLRKQYPKVDIIVIEPRRNDQEMFFCNPMRYSERLSIARHGYESVTLDLAENYEGYKQTLAGHAIPLSRRLVISELAEIRESGNDSEVIRRVLEASPSAQNRRERNTPVSRLTQTLAELEMALDGMVREAGPAD